MKIGENLQELYRNSYLFRAFCEHMVDRKQIKSYDRSKLKLEISSTLRLCCVTYFI